MAPSKQTALSWTMLTATAVHGIGSVMTTDTAVSGNLPLSCSTMTSTAP